MDSDSDLLDDCFDELDLTVHWTRRLKKCKEGNRTMTLLRD